MSTSSSTAGSPNAASSVPAGRRASKANDADAPGSSRRCAWSGANAHRLSSLAGVRLTSIGSAAGFVSVAVTAVVPPDAASRVASNVTGTAASARASAESCGVISRGSSAAPTGRAAMAT